MNGNARKFVFTAGMAFTCLALALPAGPALADPPPHAPAHGYRYKHHDHDLVYDRGLGVYIVTDMRDHYFHDGMYYHWRDGDWFVSAQLGDDGWRARELEAVPDTLLMKYGKAKPGKGQGKKPRDRH